MGIAFKIFFYRRGAEAQRKEFLGYKRFLQTLFFLRASAPLRFNHFYG